MRQDRLSGPSGAHTPATTPNDTCAATAGVRIYKVSPYIRLLFATTIARLRINRNSDFTSPDAGWPECRFALFPWGFACRPKLRTEDVLSPFSFRTADRGRSAQDLVRATTGPSGLPIELQSSELTLNQ